MMASGDGEVAQSDAHCSGCEEVDWFKGCGDIGMYCKNCGGDLDSRVDSFVSDDPYYQGGARCANCGYLYFPAFPATWNTEKWVADFERKAELVLLCHPSERKTWIWDVYLLLHFMDCMRTMVTWYFTSPEFNERERLIDLLKSMDAVRSVETLFRIIDVANNPEKALDRYRVSGDHGEWLDDAWEEITEELSQCLDPNLRQLVYDRFMRERHISEFTGG